MVALLEFGEFNFDDVGVGRLFLGFGCLPFELNTVLEILGEIRMLIFVAVFGSD